ncbi:Hypothetical protein D9617_2g054920 [Elsinoe fawcettii]|nr:Hypothetical protein D9617_2g054920 [Elsinoe fawcettii]
MANASTYHVMAGSDVDDTVLSNSTTYVIGWVSGANTRGTIDILWGAFLTIFLCTWTAVCLNIPHPEDRKVDLLLRKVKWMFWAIVGPELVLAVAIGQFASARRSVARFKSMGRDQWTLRHAFFADMGGILLEPKDSAPFLVNARQLAYLVQHDHLAFPSITQDDIWDKSKADTLSKILTLAQASWLVVHLVGRAIIRLSTSTLELSAGAIVFCTFGTFICWLHKPSDVQRGIRITTNSSTADILLAAGEAASTTYKHTPLDFVAKESFTFGYDVMGHFNLRYDNPERPLRVFPNDRFPDIRTAEKFTLFCITLAYACFHLIGWNFAFPTRTERYLWRISSVIVSATTFFFWVFETVAARQRFGRWDKYLIWMRLKKTHESAPEVEGKGKDCTANESIQRQDAFEQEQRQAKPILMWEIALILPVVIVYAAARAYMIVEVFVGLREMPLDTYRTVEVAQLLPHW